MKDKTRIVGFSNLGESQVHLISIYEGQDIVTINRTAFCQDEMLPQAAKLGNIAGGLPVGYRMNKPICPDCLMKLVRKHYNCEATENESATLKWVLFGKE